MVPLLVRTGWDCCRGATLFRFPMLSNMLPKPSSASISKLRLVSRRGGVAVLAELTVVARCRGEEGVGCCAGGCCGGCCCVCCDFGGVGKRLGLLPKEKVRLPARMENNGEDSDTGGMGTSWKLRDESCWMDGSPEEGTVEAELNRVEEELS